MERDIKRMQTLWSVVTAISTTVVVTVDGWRLTSLAWLLLLLSLRQWGAPAPVRYAMANRASSILAIAVVTLPLGALIGVLATIPDRMVCVSEKIGAKMGVLGHDRGLAQKSSPRRC